MAYLDTLSDEDRKQLEDSSGGAPTSAPGADAAPASATPAAAPASGFQNLSNYFTANADAAKAQGTATAAGIEKDAVGAIYGDDPGKAMEVYGQIDAAGRPDTLATIDQGERSGGESRLDAYLATRGADPGRFEGLRNTFGDALTRVESPMDRPDVRDPWVYTDEQKLQDATGPRSGPEDLAIEVKKKSAAAEAERYRRETQPYRDYRARTEENRAPFYDLYRYYYGPNPSDQAGG